MKLNGILVLVPFVVLTAACKGNSGKTAGVNNDPIANPTDIGRNSRRLNVYEFLQQQPNLNVIVRNGRNGAVEKLRLQFNYNGMFSYKLTTRGINSSVERGYGQVDAAQDYRAGLILRTGGQVAGQVLPFTTQQGVTCANVIMSRNQIRPAVQATVCEQGYSDNDQYDHDHDYNRRRHR